MKPFSVLLAALLSILPAFADPDQKGSADHPLLTRMPHMYIEAYTTTSFDRFPFKTAKGKPFPVEGRFFEIRYAPDAAATPSSHLAILRNHQQAVKRIGGTVLFEDDRYTTLMVAKGGKEVWVEVDTAWNGGYQLTIVEKAAMEQEVAASAALFKEGLGTSGHVEVPGIYFDSGKAALKPESRAALAEVAKLLKGNPALKVHVVGHTDAVADADLNLRLSQARAEAVVQALVAEHGVAPARLRSFGAGPFAPLASNDSEEGRARNRRVELVKR